MDPNKIKNKKNYYCGNHNFISIKELIFKKDSPSYIKN